MYDEQDAERPKIAAAPASGSPARTTPPVLPTGTITFLFTDIEGSTALWEHDPEAMQRALSRQEAIVREAMSAHGGYVYKMIGDAFQVAFSTASVALTAALAAQRALHAEGWGPIGVLKVRMALHTGVTEERGDDYVGLDLNRIARLLDAGHGGQVLLSQLTADLVRDHLPEVGEHHFHHRRRAADALLCPAWLQLLPGSGSSSTDEISGQQRSPVGAGQLRTPDRRAVG